MNPITLLATATDSSNAGYWLMIAFFAVIIGIAAIAEWRSRQWLKHYLLTLYKERDEVVRFLGDKFDTLDADGDGLITMHDLDDALVSPDPATARLATMLRDHLPTVGHLAHSEYVIVPMGCSGFGTGAMQGVQVDTYAIGRKDLVLIGERLEVATRGMIR